MANHSGRQIPPPAAQTPADWPPRMRTDMAALYLSEVHGLPLEEKTLRNWRAAGRPGPVCRYLGSLPLYDRPELDRWATDDALSPVSPISRARRRMTATEQHAA